MNNEHEYEHGLCDQAILPPSCAPRDKDKARVYTIALEPSTFTMKYHRGIWLSVGLPLQEDHKGIPRPRPHGHRLSPSCAWPLVLISLAALRRRRIGAACRVSHARACRRTCATRRSLGAAWPWELAVGRAAMEVSHRRAQRRPPLWRLALELGPRARPWSSSYALELGSADGAARVVDAQVVAREAHPVHALGEKRVDDVVCRERRGGRQRAEQLVLLARCAPVLKRENRRFEGGLWRAGWRHARPPTYQGCASKCTRASRASR